MISNSTPLATPDRSKPAILHFEITVESFRAAAARVGQYPVTVVDADTGRVVLDSRVPQRSGAALGEPDDGRYRALQHAAVSGRLVLAGGRPVAYQALPREDGNANHWIVVAAAPVAVGPLFGMGALPLGLIAAALLLMVLGGLMDLAGRRELLSAALTDALTGLGNRRMLVRDLHARLRPGGREDAFVLVLLDLNGFKAYNDTFGHAAGDSLLARLAGALATAVAPHGRAYRLGGDEFCVLAPLGPDGVEPVVAASAAALTEHGSGFTVDACYGAILLPLEAQDADAALHLVDLRMYAQKRESRRSADRQSQDVLLHALAERNPELRRRLSEVASLVGAVGERLGLSAEEAHHAVQAAELCDIGQVAVPDAILARAGAVDEQEQAFLRDQPLVAERILAAAPALVPVARLVRSVCEHVDGTGYPDGLRGSDIPLGSRIVAACHRYVALAHAAGPGTADPARLLRRIRADAGTHLDTDVVEALAAVLASAEQPYAGAARKGASVP